MRSARGGLAAVGLMLAVVPAHPAAGQISSSQVRDRYERQTRGSSIDEYVRRLNGDDPEQRLEAVRSLEESKDPKAIEYLVQALGDPDMRIKAKAIDALGNLRATDATPVLVQHLFLRETEASVKRRILASLGKIGDARAAAPIVEFLQRDLDPATRGTAIFALGEIGAPEALPVLETVQQGEDASLRRLAGEAIAKVQRHQSLLQVEAKEPQATFLKPDQPPQ
jgi:hypothetical protein